MILSREAVALLELAKGGTAVDAERAERFARAVIEATELGRPAMAVLDGGLFAGARLVELAGAVVASSPVRKALAGES